MPLPLQVAIQGGGAKIVNLLAAADALQEVSKKHSIELTHIAGTSAGSIVAAALSLNIDIRDFSAAFVASGNKYLLSLLANAPKVKLSKPESLLVWYTGTDHRIMSAYKGLEIYSLASLRESLHDLFSKFIKAEDLNFKLCKPRYLHVIASDVWGGKAKEFRDDGQNLIEALSESCAIPFVFKTYKHVAHSPYVDGGLCENLPSQFLKANDADGQIIAFSFQPAKPTYNAGSAFSYGMMLMDTAINNSMTRARLALTDDAVFAIHPTVDTLDFEKAMTHGPESNEYKTIKEETTAFLISYIARLRAKNKSVPGWSMKVTGSLIELMNRVYEYYQLAFSREKRKTKRFSLIIVGNCLLDESDPRYGQPDEVIEEIRFSPIEGSVGCLPRHFGSSNDSDSSRIPRVVRVYDNLSREVPAVIIPAARRAEDEPAGGVSGSLALLFFVPPLVPLPSDSESYRLEDRSFENVVQDLRSGTDFLGVSNVHEESIETVDIVLFYPHDFSDIDMKAVKDKGTDVVIGSRIEEAALKEYDRFRPVGFLAIGWRGHSLAQGNRLRVRVARVG